MEDALVQLSGGMCHNITSEIDKVTPPVIFWQEWVLHKVLIQGSDMVLKQVILPISSD
jgi:hypothetical protein